MTAIDKLFLLIINFIIMVLSVLLLGVYSEILEVDYLVDFLNYNTSGVEGIIVGSVLFLITIRVFQLFFRKKRVKKAVVAKGKLGSVNITLDALNSLVDDIVRRKQEVQDLQSKVQVKDNGLHIYLKLTVSADTIIPELSEELQELLKYKINQATGANIAKVEIIVKEIKKSQKMRVD